MVNPQAIKELIRDVPDFPKPGIVFKDITPILKDPQALKACVGLLAQPYKSSPPDVVIGMESRGFIFGPPVALELGAAFVPARKPGKLPAQTAGVEYELEYGTDSLEVHRDAIDKGTRVLLIDDLIATGGTAWAAGELVRMLGGEVTGAAFLIELTALGGTQRLDPIETHAVIQY